ncbi:hypothetical protein P3E12_22335, partial [Pseudomonas aeruginosa]
LLYMRTVVGDGWLCHVLMELRASPLLNRLPYIFLGEPCPTEVPDKASVNCIALSQYRAARHLDIDWL